MAKYATKPFTRIQSERRMSFRTLSDNVPGTGLSSPSITGITSGSFIDCGGTFGNFIGPFEGGTNQLANITIYFNSTATIGAGATYQVWMAPSGRFNNNCTDSYMRPLTSGSGSITGGVSSFTFNNNSTTWQNAELIGTYYNTSTNIPNAHYGYAAFYKICMSNAAGSGCSPWTAVVVKGAYNCNVSCPGGYEENCCCYDCNNDGITCCDGGNPVENCCRGECDPGDPGSACGFSCPGGEVYDTCYNCNFAPLNTGACS